VLSRKRRINCNQVSVGRISILDKCRGLPSEVSSEVSEGSILRIVGHRDNSELTGVLFDHV
jgi:hypothetical protein